MSAAKESDLLGHTRVSQFFALLDFCMPACLGTRKEFNKTFNHPIIKGRDLDATEKEVKRGKEASEKFTAVRLPCSVTTHSDDRALRYARLLAAGQRRHASSHQ